LAESGIEVGKISRLQFESGVEVKGVLPIHSPKQVWKNIIDEF
jgi:hypothetical protein